MDRAVFHRFDGGFCQWSGFDIPLVGEEGFDNRAGAVSARHHEFVVIDLFYQVLGF